MERRSALQNPLPFDARAATTSPAARAWLPPVPATEPRRPIGAECSILAPPYDALGPLRAAGPGDLAPPLGAIAHASGQPVLGALATLTATVRYFPWVAPCIAVAPDEECLEPCIEFVSELGDRLAVVHRHGPVQRIPMATIVEAVRRRSPPPADAMAGYVARRLGHPELLAPLRHQFEQALEGVPATASASIATYSRFFARYGRFSARHWRALAHLGWMLAGGSQGATDRPDALSRSPVRNRTAVRHARRLLDLSWSVATRRVGWEWVLERALRVGGYIARCP